VHRQPFFFACLIAMGVSVLAQQAPPIFRSGVDAVQIDAFVTDRDGNPVSNLTADDFEVLEDNKPQLITSFSEVNIPIRQPEPFSETAPEPDVVTNTGGEGRLYVIVLDEVHPANALKARHFLRTFIEQHFEANDIGAVVSVGRARSGDMQDFTSNRRLLLNAIDRFSGGFPLASGDDLTDPHTFAQPIQTNVGAQARALRDLMESLVRINGRRKAVIYVTSEVGSSDVTAIAGANVWNVIDYRGGVKSLAFDDLRAAMTAAMSGGVAFYTIDPAGLCALDCAPDASENLERMSGLRKLADATGGFGITNSNRITETFPRLVAENSNYYVLGYTTNGPRDGRYRQLKVRVKRPGLTVRARDGYIAPSKSDKDSEPKARAPMTLSAGVGESIGSPLSSAAVGMSVFAGSYRGTGKEANVVISVQMDATRLGLVNRDGTMNGQVEVAAVAVSAGGKVTRGQRERFSLALKPDSWNQARNTGVRVVTGMALPAGRYQLRIAAGDTAADKAGSVMYDLEVPDFSKPPLAISSLTIASREHARTLTVGSTTVRPVVPEAPVTTRDFAAGGGLTVYAEIYDNRAKEPHQLELIAELRASDGQRVGRAVTETRRDGSAVQKFEPSVPLDVPPGAYVLHVEARSSNPKQPAVSRNVPLRVQ
jgi:VWFA-related protein